MWPPFCPKYGRNESRVRESLCLRLREETSTAEPVSILLLNSFSKKSSGLYPLSHHHGQYLDIANHLANPCSLFPLHGP